MPFYGKDTTWAGKTPSLLNSFGHIKKAINDPTYILKPSYWAGAKASRKQQQIAFDKLYSKGQQFYNKSMATNKRKYAGNGKRPYKKRKTTHRKGAKPKYRTRRAPSSRYRSSTNGSKRKVLYANGYLSQISLVYKTPKSKGILQHTKNNTQITRRVPFSSNATAGTQNVNLIGSFTTTRTLPMNRDDLINLYNTGAKFYDYTAGAWNTSTATVGTQLITDASGKKMFVSSCRNTFIMTNQGPTSLEFDIYFLLPKQSGAASDPLTLWDLGYSTSLADLGAAFQKNKSNIYAKPTDSKDFNFAYTIVKKLTGKLEPGQEHKCIFNYKPNRYFDTSYLNSYLDCKGVYPLIPMLVTRGVAADSANAPAAGTITTSQVKLVGYMTTEYWGYVCDTRSTFKRVLGTALPDPVNVYSIADAAGTVVDSKVATNFA